MNIIKPEQPLPPEKLITVIYGPPGVAKTSLAFTADHPVLFDFDQGVKRAVGRRDINKVNAYEEIIKMIDNDEMKGMGYKTAIIDTGGNLLDRYASDYVCRVDFKNKNASGGLTLSGYGAIQVVFKRLMDYLRRQDMDIVIICHGVEKETAGDNLRLRPRMTGGSYNIMMEMADMVGYMEMLNDKVTINFNPTDKHVGKNCGELPPTHLPHYLDPKWNDFLANLINATRAKIETMTEAQKEAVQLVSNFNKTISELSKPEEFDKVSQEISSTPDWCRVALSKVLLERIKSLGIRYNTEKKLFEVIPEPTPVVPAVPVETAEQVKSRGDYEKMIADLKAKDNNKKLKATLTASDQLYLGLHALGVFNDKAYKAVPEILDVMKELGCDVKKGLEWYCEMNIKPQPQP